MNQEQKGERYDWLLSQYRQIENQINMVPKLPLEETFQDVNSKEYTIENLNKVNHLKQQLLRIDAEVKTLF
jgi:hypothetical protein|tara:strand:+ start:279 stop:491 length:213 start_codon:yes stop_codon:yes gene_type:complete